MTKRGQTLLAAVASTVCAVLWLANCAADVTIVHETARMAALHGLCAAAWTMSAGLWWTRWLRGRAPDGYKEDAI